MVFVWAHKCMDSKVVATTTHRSATFTVFLLRPCPSHPTRGKKQTTVHPPIRDSINSSTIGVLDILLEQCFVKLHDTMFPRYQAVSRSTESSLLTLNIYRASQNKHWHKSSYDSATVVVRKCIKPFGDTENASKTIRGAAFLTGSGECAAARVVSH